MKHLKFFLIFLVWGLCVVDAYSQDCECGTKEKDNFKGSKKIAEYKSGALVHTYVQLALDSCLLKLIGKGDSVGIKERKHCLERWREYARADFYKETGENLLYQYAKENDSAGFELRKGFFNILFRGIFINV